MTMSNAAKSTHDAAIADQFSRQAAQFAASAMHHNQVALDLLVEAAQPQPENISLDVACGPGSVVAAFARRVRRAEGLDATEAMLDEARKLSRREDLRNVVWHHGDLYALPFATEAFDIVSCRYAFHHLLEPARALAEMARVCRRGGRVVLCDAFASADPIKAAAFNTMERHRDPSTVEFRTLGFLRSLFTETGLRQPEERFYGLPAELERLIAMAYPMNDDRDGLRAMIEAAVDHDSMGVRARREGGTVRFEYPVVVFAAVKGG
jgi:ubiquinone/menaquinone biosynthesis C-methylase UbiE